MMGTPTRARKCTRPAVVALALAALSLAPRAARAQDARILVVPFATGRAEPRIYWLSEGAADLIAEDLNALGTTAITRPQRVRAFGQLHLPLNATLSLATVIKVGQIVAATEVVVGSLELNGDELTVRAQSLRLETGRIQSELVEKGPLADLFAIFERVARRLGGKPLTAPPLDRQRPPLDAFENYVKGLIAEAPASQARFLEAAVKVYPAYDRARLALWEVRTEGGNHAAALAAVTGVSPTSPLARRARFLAALSRLELKQYDEALAGFRSLSDERPAAAIDNNMGIVLLRKGWTTQSGRPTYYFDRAAKAAPDSDYLFNLGYAYVVERDLPAALYWLREAVRRNPADGDAHFVLGLALQATGSTAEGGREKELARQLSSKYEEWEHRSASDKEPFPRALERVRLELEAPLASELDAAIVNPALREQRDLARFHLEQGRRLYEKEQDREAIAELRRSIYLSPYQAEAHLILGRIHLRAGRTREAIDEFKISLWSGETAAAHVALGEAYYRLGDLAQARIQAHKALALEPNSAEARRLLDQLDRRKQP